MSKGGSREKPGRRKNVIDEPQESITEKVERTEDQQEKFNSFSKARKGGLKGQCSFHAAYGQCGLRGGVSMEGSALLCSYHHAVRFNRAELSIMAFREWRKAEILAGDRTWLRHDDVWWWDRITGRKEPFTSTDEERRLATEFREDEMRRLGGGPE